MERTAVVARQAVRTLAGSMPAHEVITDEIPLVCCILLGRRVAVIGATKRCPTPHEIESRPSPEDHGAPCAGGATSTGSGAPCLLPMCSASPSRLAAFCVTKLARKDAKAYDLIRSVLIYGQNGSLGIIGFLPVSWALRGWSGVARVVASVGSLPQSWSID